MNIRLMQRIDYWFGIPLTWLLSLLLSIGKKLGGLWPSPSKRLLNDEESVLFIELSEMGSTVIAYSSLKHAWERTNGKVYFLTFKQNAESVYLLDLLGQNHVFTINANNIFSFLVSTLKTIFQIRRIKPTICVDLELFSRCTAILSFLTGASKRAGFFNAPDEGLYRGQLVNRPVRYNPHQHIALNFLNLTVNAFLEEPQYPVFQANTASLLIAPPRFTPSNDKLIWARELLVSLGWKQESPLVLLNPDPGALPLRGWPKNNYYELISLLLAARPDLFFGVVGLKSARVYFEAIASEASDISPATKTSNKLPERVMDLTGKTKTLHDLLTIISLAKAFITVDSGPAHFATLLSVPSIVLFGPETPRLYRPHGENCIALSTELGCSPCFSAWNHRRSLCNNNVCLQTISPQMLAENTLSILAQRESA